MDVFNHIGLEYNTDVFLSVKNMTERKMMIKTRPSYPSSKLTFNIADLTKEKNIDFLNIVLILNEQYDVDVVLEDSKRNFMNSCKSYNVFFYNL